MQTTLLGLASAITICGPIYYAILKRPFYIFTLPPMIQDPFDVTVLDSGEPSLIDWSQNKLINMKDFQAEVMSDQSSISLSVFQKQGATFLLDNLSVLRRTPDDHPKNFNTDWHHTGNVLTHKAIKELMVEDGLTGQQELNAEQIQKLLFDNDRFLLRVNHILYNMTRLVMKSPTYKQMNTKNQNFQKALEGNPDDINYCVVNFDHCNIELKTIWLLQALEDNDNHFMNQQLLDYSIFDHQYYSEP